MAVAVAIQDAPNLAEFNVEPDDAGVMPASRKFQYLYWRLPNGYLSVGPAWDVEYARQVKKKMQPLDSYGEVDFDDDRKSPFFSLLQKGGAKEFPVEQVLEYGWHRKPPYRGVVFPQLAGSDHVDVPCPNCRKPFLSAELLTRHEQIAHAKAANNQHLARALADAQREGMGGAMGDVLKAIIGTQEQQTAILAKLLERLDTKDAK